MGLLAYSYGPLCNNSLLFLWLINLYVTIPYYSYGPMGLFLWAYSYGFIPMDLFLWANSYGPIPMGLFL